MDALLDCDGDEAFDDADGRRASMRGAMRRTTNGADREEGAVDASIVLTCTILV